jgi:hypothetical protein
MILDCVISACNDNPLYIEFVPLFIDTWKKLYPQIDVKVILILNSIPDNLINYQNNLILFPPLENISTAFTSQYIRLLYPAILNYSNGILISDIDMIPMNRTYYTKNIENISNDKFIYLRNVLLDDWHEIAMCYNVALKETWSDIFGIYNLNDIINRLRDVFNGINYVDGHGAAGWNKDQVDFYNYVMRWNNRTNNFVVLPDSNTGYSRLDRHCFYIELDSDIKNKISNGFFSDYHLYRPFSQYREVNMNIYNLL